MFTYRVPESLAPHITRGAYVRMPFRARSAWGIVTAAHDHSPVGVRTGSLRDLQEVRPDLLLTDAELHVVERLAMTTGVSPATTAYLLFPVPPTVLPRQAQKTTAVVFWASHARRTNRAPIPPWTTRAARTAGDTIAIFHTQSQRLDAMRAFAAAVLQRARSVAIITPHRAEIEHIRRAVASVGRPVILVTPDGGSHAAWQAACAARGPRVISIATRAGAWFAPENLGGVIVDLADADGHNQWDAEPRYDARAVSATVARDRRFPRLLLSTAPRLEEWISARHRIDLGQPSSEGHLEVIDLAAAWRSGARGFLTDELVEAIRAAAGERRGVIVLHNRRGRAGRLTCRDCLRTIDCPSCHLPLLEDAQGLRCRSCDARSDIPAACPFCGSALVVGRGIGTIRVAELLSEHFPDLQIARVDRDDPDLPPEDADITIGSERFLASVAPQITGPIGLVAVLHAERFVRADDFRADERLLQALRNAHAWARTWGAHVLIQATDPDSPSLRALTGSLTTFYRSALEARCASGFPPATRLITIDAPGSADRHTLDGVGHLIERAARGTLRGLGGPLPVRVGRQSRRRLTIRLDPGTDDATLAAVARAVPSTWTVDPDPIDLM